MDIGDIIEGHFNELIGKNETVSQSRLKICYKCPLYTRRLGGTCNSRLWLNPETGDVKTYPMKGYKNGCGCRLQSKTRVLDNHCPLNKW